MPRSDRLFALADLLRGPKRRALDELARELDTSPRSIYRDLADLERRGIPIERVDGTYRLMDGATMRPLQLTGRERLLLTAALENPALELKVFAAPLRQLRAKLSDLRPEQSGAVLSGPDRSGDIDPRVIDSLDEAIRGSHSVSILYTSLYTSLSGAQERWRSLDPWLIFHRSEAWYLVGRCHEHQEPRTFRLDRVRDVLPIGQSFERPSDFDVDQWLSASWGVLQGDVVEEAVVIFDPSLVPLIEHARHHPSESKCRLDDGSLEYRVKVSRFEELARWIAGFGGAARAVGPAALVEMVRRIASSAAATHAPEQRAAAMTRRAKKRKTR